ncbi:neprilysin-1 [Dermacentor silvarum]|uniref:neprilysin-1 n=1 Tax=Dermacentor silvarum TaxID=543639 RepID=UPI00189AE7E2|nr:neprilysin-1 [Dermacentor silvarum]
MEVGTNYSSLQTKELAAWMTSLGLDLNNLTSSEPFDPVDMLVRCSLDFGIPVLLTFSLKNVIMVNNKRLIMVLRPRQDVLNDTVDSENLGDLGGTTMAYSAFTSLPPSKRDITLPGVAMTANQLFFVGHCTPWCEKRTTNSPPWLAGYDRYPPGRSRCIVPLMNMPEFSDAFHCKQGSYMNPPNKCMFWT